MALLTRNTMYSHSKGMGLWYYDFGPGGFYTHPDRHKFPDYCLTGYWDHPRYWECIRRLKQIFDQKTHQDYQSEADVLLVYDTKSQYHVQSVGAGDPGFGPADRQDESGQFLCRCDFRPGAYL